VLLGTPLLIPLSRAFSPLMVVKLLHAVGLLSSKISLFPIISEVPSLEALFHAEYLQ